MTFIIWEQTLVNSVQFKNEYYDENFDLDTLSFGSLLVQSKWTPPNTTQNPQITTFSVDPKNDGDVSDNHVFFNFKSYKNVVNLLKVKLSTVEFPYLINRHIKCVSDMLSDTNCVSNFPFIESIINLALNRLLFNRYNIFHQWYKKSYIIEFMVNAILASDSQRLIDLCLYRETILYPYIDKKIVVEPNNDEYEFYNPSTDKWVKLSDDTYSILLDTGNQSYTLIGSNIANAIGIRDIHKQCKKIKAKSGTGHSLECDYFVILKFKIPSYSNSEFAIKAFIDSTNVNILIFGWKSGLDVLYENRFVFYKQKHTSLVNNKLNIVKKILNLSSQFLNIQLDPANISDSDIENIINRIKRMISSNPSFQSLSDMANNLFDDYYEIKNIIDRNIANNTLDMY